ncbi:uncharacterized protein E5676_scaffold482G00190 [Cucumis melo var. makuwa]|uniref:Reverse transcriptase/retrotransposon-derived protein RNase H-like domain-containing protein n=1 Tax=Cucumis melo var. makuwa TaxID=1194695 RepID=A0A5D3DF63_CUCMM|nr:uncharacterized protein E6C27_scaffold269G00650 [Cucumis melo var. makuwa]TYK21989.1 uncharacterized protein E5676_scaffold482G00190 [Cucumis melo var. makuwa]
MTHAPTYTMLVGEPTLTSVEDNKVKAIKGDKVVTEITARNDALLQSQATSIRNLELQLGQLAKEFSRKQQKSLPSNNETPNQAGFNVATNDFFKKGVPEKMTDLESFMVPCSIGRMDLGHALYDLGASTNLMPIYIFKKLEIREAFQTLKDVLTSGSIFIAPDWSQPFELMCDVSDVVVGNRLGQKKDKVIQIVYYASKTLNSEVLIAPRV